MRASFLFLSSIGALIGPGLGAQPGGGEPFVPLSGGDDVNWRQVARDFDDRFLAVTPPIPVERLALPWDPVHATVLVIPLKEWGSDPALAQIVRDLLAALLVHGPVVGLYDENDYRLLADWWLEMEQDPEIGSKLGAIEMVPCQPFSLWARDFVPLFARSASGRLLAVDPSFIPARRMMNNLQNAKAELDPWEQYFNLRESTKELQGRRGADKVGSDLMPFLEARWQWLTALSRPPVYLLGGDLLLVDHKTALVSSETLIENGGRSAFFEASLRDYLGIERVIALENLPGDSIEHLDFVLQPLGPEVMIVASPPETIGSDRLYHRFLERELHERLRRNRERLARLFPDHRIVEVPMLPPLLDDETAVVDELLLHCVQEIATANNLPFWPDQAEGDPLAEESLDQRLLGFVRLEMGLRNWDDPAARRRAVASYLDQPIEPLIARHVEKHVRYRSYVNSLLLRRADGSARVLVPRFSPANEAEVARVARLEEAAEAAYREALPDAEIVWIDCSDLADYLGAVHCLTATIPDPAALGIERRAE